MTLHKNKIKIFVFFIYILLKTMLQAQTVRNLHPVETYIPAMQSLGDCNKFLLQNQIFSPSGNFSLFTVNNLILSNYSFNKHNTIAFYFSQTTFPMKILNNYKTQFSYIYSFKINKNTSVAMSIPVNYVIKKYNGGVMVTPSMIDEWGIDVNRRNINISDTYTEFNADFSMALKNKNTKLGISVTDLLSISYNDVKNIPNIFLLGEKKISLKKINLTNAGMIEITTSGILYRYTLLAYDKKILGGVIFGQSFSKKIISSIGFTAGINFGKFYIIYTYEFSTGYNHSGIQSNELILAYKFKCGKKYKKNTIICPAYQL